MDVQKWEIYHEIDQQKMWETDLLNHRVPGFHFGILAVFLVCFPVKIHEKSRVDGKKTWQTIMISMSQKPIQKKTDS